MWVLNLYCRFSVVLGDGWLNTYNTVAYAKIATMPLFIF